MRQEVHSRSQCHCTFIFPNTKLQFTTAPLVEVNRMCAPKCWLRGENCQNETLSINKRSRQAAALMSPQITCLCLELPCLWGPMWVYCCTRVDSGNQNVLVPYQKKSLFILPICIIPLPNDITQLRLRVTQTKHSALEEQQQVAPESVWAVSGQMQGYTLSKLPVFRRAVMKDKQPSMQSHLRALN